MSSSAADRFLAAMSVRERSFMCPRTGLRVTLRAPSYRDQQVARAAVDAAWGDREKHNLNLAQYMDDIQVQLLAAVATIEGEVIGADALGQLDEKTLEMYVEKLDELRSDAGEAMSAGELDAAIDELKKKQSTIEDTLNSYDSGKLRALLARSVALLSTSPTPS